jgi:hypothetical protein
MPSDYTNSLSSGWVPHATMTQWCKAGLWSQRLVEQREAHVLQWQYVMSKLMTSNLSQRCLLRSAPTPHKNTTQHSPIHNTLPPTSSSLSSFFSSFLAAGAAAPPAAGAAAAAGAGAAAPAATTDKATRLIHNLMHCASCRWDV